MTPNVSVSKVEQIIKALRKELLQPSGADPAHAFADRPDVAPARAAQKARIREFYSRRTCELNLTSGTPANTKGDDHVKIIAISFPFNGTRSHRPVGRRSARTDGHAGYGPG